MELKEIVELKSKAEDEIRERLYKFTEDSKLIIDNVELLKYGVNSPVRPLEYVVKLNIKL